MFALKIWVMFSPVFLNSVLLFQIVSNTSFEAIDYYIIFGLQFLLLLLNIPGDRKTLGIVTQERKQSKKKRRPGKKNELQLLLDDNDDSLPSADIGPVSLIQFLIYFFLYDEEHRQS